jgi:hypothetical protein
MTTAPERFNALILAEDFLSDLLDTKLTPKIPRYIRQRASRCLRHWPREYELEELRKLAPDILGCPDTKKKRRIPLTSPKERVGE